MLKPRCSWVLLVPALLLNAQQPDPVKLTPQEDHQRLMDLLHIKEVRRGRDGNNKDSPYYANYDESKANPYPTLPDPLLLKNGKKIAKASDWWSKRRPEIEEDFDREIYGRVPKNVPKVKWEVASTTKGMNGDVAIVTKQLVGTVDNSSYPQIAVKIQVSLTTPAEAKGSVPVIMQFGGFGFGAPAPAAPEGPPYLPNAFAPPPPPRRGGTPSVGPPRTPSGPTWQQQVLAKGWGYAIIVPGSIQADNGYGLTLGIVGLVNHGQPRKVDDWGALRAWAWGASRALDYFETDKSVNAKRIGLEGHSRYGKATLVAMAYDPRLWVAYVSSSGEGGAKLNRRDWGEIVENVAGSGEYHWMAGNFIKYSGPLNWGELPVDAHELIAMCAPRPVSSAEGRRMATAGSMPKECSWRQLAPGQFTSCSARKIWARAISHRSRLP